MKPSKKNKFRKAVLLMWVAAVITLLCIYYLNREAFDLIQLKDLVNEHKIEVVVIYLAILSFLGLTFIPSTPFAIGGVLLFSPTEAYIFNLIGILTSSTIVYYFAQFLGLDEVFEQKYPKKIKKIREKLLDKELPIITVWSAIPFVPTDLMIYVSSSLKIRVWKALLGVLIGEGILNAFYIFSVDFVTDF